MKITLNLELEEAIRVLTAIKSEIVDLETYVADVKCSRLIAESRYEALVSIKERSIQTLKPIAEKINKQIDEFIWVKDEKVN